MLKHKIIDIYKKDMDDIEKELDSYSTRGWELMSSFGKSNRYLILCKNLQQIN